MRSLAKKSGEKAPAQMVLAMDGADTVRELQSGVLIEIEFSYKDSSTKLIQLFTIFIQ